MCCCRVFDTYNTGGVNAGDIGGGCIGFRMRGKRKCVSLKIVIFLFFIF